MEEILNSVLRECKLTFDQSFNVPLERKEIYGEVKTDFKLIRDMFSLIPKHLFKNPGIRWCDPCCGSGEFMIFLYKVLDKTIEIEDVEKRRRHIKKTMLWMVEINECHIPILKSIFGEESNIIHGSYLDINDLDVDIIVGNPPFNINGRIKVPTNKYRVCKKTDGISIWGRFVIHSLFTMLKKSRYGYLLFITPSIWMKKDYKLNKIMLNHSIYKIRTMNSSETNIIFHGNAQTPTSYFLMSKRKRHKHPRHPPIKIYDNVTNKYIPYNYISNEGLISSLPLCGISILNKIHKYNFCRRLSVYKSNMRPGYKNLSISNTKDNEHPYPNITTCLLKKNQPILKINYSNIKCEWEGIPKIVFAHKMYGFPYFDREGKFGISNRDNYIIHDYLPHHLERICDFFYTKLGLYVLEMTRYRMRYLEKYIFNMIPDVIAKLEVVTDESVNNLFELSELERKYINTFHSKDYLKTILVN